MMKNASQSPEDRDIMTLRKRFPTARARWAADKAVDRLDVNASMAVYIDTWVAAYRAAGGKEKEYKDD